MSEGAMRVRIQIDQSERQDGFVDYLHRLGCTVSDCGAGRFDACVTYPETVDDEAAAIAEWCAAWSLAHAPSRAVICSIGGAALNGIPGERRDAKHY